MKGTSYWKLGLFSLLGLGLAIVAIVYFGSGIWGRATVDYQVYFDESVQGLVTGARVTFRGVTVGQVSRIAVAPDGRHVQVTCSLLASDLRAQNLAVPGSHPTRLRLTPELRAQQSLIGLSGEELVLLDYLDPAAHPVATLPFATPERTIPWAASTLRNIEDRLEGATARLPALLGATQDLEDAGRALVAQLSREDVGGLAGRALRRFDRVLAVLQAIADRFAATGAPEELGSALQDLSAALSRMDALIDEIASTDGLAVSARRAADALGATLRGVGPVGRDIDETLRQAGETLLSIRRLANTLQRQPDALIKGRARTGP